MNARTMITSPVGMEQARRRLARWRETRTPGSPIPDSLWAIAVELTRQHGVHRTARALGLEYNKLKRLSQSAEHRQKVLPSPAFGVLSAGLILLGRDSSAPIESQNPSQDCAREDSYLACG